LLKVFYVNVIAFMVVTQSTLLYSYNLT